MIVKASRKRTAAFQSPVAEGFGGGPDGEHFGVGGGVGVQRAAVMGGGDDLAVTGDDGPDGHVAIGGGPGGLGDGQAHQVFVSAAVSAHCEHFTIGDKKSQPNLGPGGT